MAGAAHAVCRVGVLPDPRKIGALPVKGHLARQHKGGAQLLPLFAGRKFPDRIQNVGGIRNAVFICAKLAVARGILPKPARIGAVSERMGAETAEIFSHRLSIFIKIPRLVCGAPQSQTLPMPLRQKAAFLSRKSGGLRNKMQEISV